MATRGPVPEATRPHPVRGSHVHFRLARPRVPCSKARCSKHVLKILCRLTRITVSPIKALGGSRCFPRREAAEGGAAGGKRN